MFIIKNPDDLSDFFNTMRSTNHLSHLELLYDAKSFYNLVQRISSSCYAIEGFINSKNYKSSKLEVDVEGIQRTFTGYLNRIDVLDLNLLMLTATALKKVLDLPVARVSEDVLKGAVKIVVNMVRFIDNTVTVHKNIIQREQLDDFGVVLCQISSKILGQKFGKIYKVEGKLFFVLY